MEKLKPTDQPTDLFWTNQCFSLDPLCQHQEGKISCINVKHGDLPAAADAGRQDNRAVAQGIHHRPAISDFPDAAPSRGSNETCIFRLLEENTGRKQDHHREQVKQVFSDAQRMAYVGLCYLTSLEMVEDYYVGGNTEPVYARMSADNWQRRLMRSIYAHMDIEPSEIRMVESLPKHQISPGDLIQNLGLVKTVQIHRLNEESDPVLTQDQESSSTLDIDMRWTIVCDLLLLFLSTESLDARSRVLLGRLCQQDRLGLSWDRVLEFEKRISDCLLLDSVECNKPAIASAARELMHGPMLILNQTEKTSRNKERRKRRLAMIGLATLGGGVILGVSVGLMAPLIAGGLGTVLSTAGVSGATGFLSGTTGIALITSSATGIGGGLGAKSMKKRMKTIQTFEFVPVTLNDRVNCIISVSGWLPKKGTKDAAALPFTSLSPAMGDHYTLYWEPEMLEKLGSAFRIFATEVVSFSIQQALAHTIMAALLAGLAWPMALTKLGYLVDNPWHNGLDRARLAGLVLADTIMNRNLGGRPVTLVGYSLGARVIFFCLSELARMKAFGLVEHVALFGTPVSASATEWEACASVVAGRCINGYCGNDWLLGFLFRPSTTTTTGMRNVAGLRPIRLDGRNNTKIENMDCTNLVRGHLSYRTCMPQLLERAGFVVSSPDKQNLAWREREGDGPVLDLSLAKQLEHFRSASMERGFHSFASSLSSGKASIHYPPPKPDCSLLVPELNDERTSENAIIAEIIAVSKYTSCSPHRYSSLSSGRASLAANHRRSLSVLQDSTNPSGGQSSSFFSSRKHKRQSDPGTLLLSTVICHPCSSTTAATTSTVEDTSSPLRSEHIAAARRL